MSYIVDSDLFDDNWSDFSSDVVNACVELVLYGVYIVLFILAVYTLARRQSAGKKLLLGYTWTMAVLGTLQLVLCLVELWIAARFVGVLVKQDVAGNLTSEPELTRLALLGRSLDAAQLVIFAGNNLTTDSLLLYRCFVIWGSDWRPVVLPAVLMACTFVAACVDALVTVPVTLFHVPYILAALTNLVLVGLIGGRIWWIRQDARLLAGSELRKRYDTAIAMVIESGAVYFGVLVLLAIFATDLSGITCDILQSIAMHTVNIAPTLIIVRVGLGQNIQDTGKISPANEARNTYPRARAHFSAHQSRLPIPHVFDIKASEDSLTP